MNTTKEGSARSLSKGCETAQRDISLAVYGELPDDASHRLNHHLAECGHCRQELEAVQGLRQAMSLYPMLDPSPNLLTRVRLRLEEALDAVPRSGWMTKVVDRFFNGIARVQSAPAMASAVLLLGLSAGGLAGYHMGFKEAGSAIPPARISQDQDGVNEGLKVADIRNVERQPGSDNVKISYDRVVPETMAGSLDDPTVRDLLLKGAASHIDPGVREVSLGLLADECQSGRQCGDGPIRDALMVALRHDKDPKVRLRALEGLQPYVAQDRSVRNVVLSALLKDSDSKVRIKAVDLLQPVDSDSSVRQALHNVADTDENPYLRTVSRQVLNGLPEVQ